MTSSRSRRKVNHIFIGMADVAGYFSRIGVGLLDEGCRVTVVFVTNPLSYEHLDERFSQPPRPILNLISFGRQRRLSFGFVLELLGRILLLAWTLVKCDAYIFASGLSFIRRHDIRLIRLLGKTTLAVFTGSDARPPYLSGIEWRGPNTPDLAGMRRRTRRTARHIHHVESTFDEVISHPTYSQLQQRPFYAFLSVGLPAPAVSSPLAGAVGSKRKVPLILHAPTRPLHKGTAEIEKALDSLHADGYKFNYRRLEGLPNSQVLEALATADLLIDELYGDTLLGSLGVEAAASGCAVLVAGYASKTLRDSHNTPLPPIDLIDPNDLLPQIRLMLSDCEFRSKAKRELQEFVSYYWAGEMVANRILAILEGRGDLRWMVDPADIVYIGGWGVSREVLSQGISNYLELYGPVALGVKHNPKLETALATLWTKTR